MKIPLFVLSVSLFCSLGAAAQQSTATESTRGIGLYPGRATETFAPTMHCDSVFRNVALMRKASASSHADRCLTAQLITDGMVENNSIKWIEVITPEGVLPAHAAEWTFDGGRYSEQMLRGSSSFIEYRWHGRHFNLSEIHITGRVAHAEAADNGYCIRVLGSGDGKHYTEIGRAAADTLPGTPLKWRLHSDPNKQTDNDLIPARNIDCVIPLDSSFTFSFLRIEFQMDKAVYWMVWDTAFFSADDNGLLTERQDMNSNAVFSSAWMSNGGGEEWVEVDLGTLCHLSKIDLLWILPPRDATLMSSVDGVDWQMCKRLKKPSKNAHFIDTDIHARYLKILLHKSGKANRYALSELRAWGTGGLHPEPASRRGWQNGRYYLNGGLWTLQRNDSVSPALIATVPATFLSTYMDNQAVGDVNLGSQLMHVSDSYFNKPFTYSTSFDFEPPSDPHRTLLCFDGVNWQADIVLNGTSIGQTKGAFHRTQIDVTDLLLPQGNHLEVTVCPPAHPGAPKTKTLQTTGTNGGRLAADSPTFLASVGWDWISTVPGRNAGIYGSVYLKTHGGASLSDPYVETRLQEDTTAIISPRVFVKNTGNEPRNLLVRGTVGGYGFEKSIAMAPESEKEVVWTFDEMADFGKLHLPLWWCNGLGAPVMHDACFEVLADGVVLDSLHFKVGLRELSYAHEDSALQIYLNHKRIVPMGGNWGFSEMNLAYRGREYQAALNYHRDMHFNMIRNWVGQVAEQEFYDQCDEKGILLWQDFWLANPADGPDPSNHRLFLDNATDLIRKIRRHPAMALYCGRNEGFPPLQIDSTLRAKVESLHPDLLYISSSADLGVSGHGPYRALMANEYFREQTGKLHTERGMPCVMTPESFLRMMNGEKAWEQNDIWGQHDFTLQGAQGGTSFNSMVAGTLGTPTDEQEFCRVSQLINYNGYRAMFESMLTQRQGLLIWMSHPCWPTQVWQTYDYFLCPTGAYFGAKKACQPLHAMYNPAEQSIQMVKTSGCTADGISICADLFNRHGKRVLHREFTDRIVADTTVTLAVLKELEALAETHFLRLTVHSAHTEDTAENLYILPARENDIGDLKEVPAPDIQMEWTETEVNSAESQGRLLISNNGSSPAVFLQISLLQDQEEPLLPAIYSDNYITLMPGEQRCITVSWKHEDRRKEPLRIVITDIQGRQFRHVGTCNGKSGK